VQKRGAQKNVKKKKEGGEEFLWELSGKKSSCPAVSRGRGGEVTGVCRRGEKAKLGGGGGGDTAILSWGEKRRFAEKGVDYRRIDKGKEGHRKNRGDHFSGAAREGQVNFLRGGKIRRKEPCLEGGKDKGERLVINPSVGFARKRRGKGHLSGKGEKKVTNRGLNPRKGEGTYHCACEKKKGYSSASMGRRMGKNKKRFLLMNHTTSGEKRDSSRSGRVSKHFLTRGKSRLTPQKEGGKVTSAREGKENNGGQI